MRTPWVSRAHRHTLDIHTTDPDGRTGRKSPADAGLFYVNGDQPATGPPVITPTSPDPYQLM